MKRAYIWMFVALLAVYWALALTLPPDPAVLEKHNLSLAEARLLNLSILVPLSIIYLTAFYGFSRLRNYSDKVSSSKEGPHLLKISYGLGVLAYSLVVNSIIGSLSSYVRSSGSQWLPEVTIARNYLLIALAAVALFLIARGAEGLVSTLKKKSERNYLYLKLLGIISLSSIYTLLITSTSYESGEVQPYYLDSWAIVVTLAIPYTFIWCIGIKAAFQINNYKDHLKGRIYKRAFSNISKGILFIIAVSIFIQIITTLSGQLNRINLTPLLAIVYLLIVLYAVGYGLVARGSRKLNQIEEV